MADAVSTALDEGCDWLLMAAAVADHAPSSPADAKLKKEELGETWQLDLARNPDILADIVAPRRHPGLTVVGFALETGDLVALASAKRSAKAMDYVLANDPTSRGSGFGDTNHKVTLIGSEGVIWESESLPKTELAAHILDRLEAAQREHGP